MYLEDIITSVMMRIKLNPYDSNLIMSLEAQVTRGTSLTEKQSAIAIKILKRYVPQINLLDNYKNIDQWLDNPTYRLGIRTIITVKHISILKNVNKIKVQFPYDDNLVKEIKKERNKFIAAEWTAEDKAWLFSLEDKVIAFLVPWVTDRNFTADDEFLRYIEQTKEITNHIEKYIPMLAYDGKNIKYINAHSSVPELTSNDLIQSLLEARRAGITTWGNDVSTLLSDGKVSNIVKKFIESNPSESFSIDLGEDSILELKDIVKSLLPCIVVVPGGNELKKSQQALELLKAIGVENHEISMLFRLPSQSGKDFNNFVKEEKLNSPITEKTRAVFLSGKVPKPLFESKLKFNCVINLNFYNVHYTLANLIKTKHNVINVIADKKQKSTQIEYM